MEGKNYKNPESVDAMKILPNYVVASCA